ncbi:MAG: HIT domain-containing protein [Chloroflexota bacterium]|nr:HIT domain-containing protein [Chloroflexota bacterium]
MKQIWAPWRMAYIQRESKEGCVLCEKPASDDDAANYILYRGERAYIMLNLYPYNNGHLMVVPYEHVASLEGLGVETLTELMLLIKRSLAALREAMAPDGFNIGVNVGQAAGAGIQEHVHIHIVPRWEGDTNFMPVLGETRVIPQMLRETYDQLLEVFQEGMEDFSNG